MLIKSFRVQNYKSYLDSGDIRLSSGFNVIVGQNNVGKTALVEALSLRGGSSPHRSLKTLPTRQTPVNPESRVKLTFALTAEESKTLLSELPKPLYVPRSSGEDELEVFKQLHAQMDSGFTFDCTYSLSEGRWVSATYRGVEVQQNNPLDTFVTRTPGNEPPFGSAGGTQVHGSNSLPLAMATHLKQRVYAFRAERLNVAESAHGVATALQPDASNLAQVLNYLQTSNPKRWEKLVGYVRNIFPDVTEITVPSTGSGNVRILVWSIPTDTERDDLAISLAESGTGIGQVLAMLYVVLTANTPQPIVIDEPQSFLHPGAIRKLFDILRLYTHQYVVVTHSPTVVDAAMPPTMILVRHVGAESQLEQLDAAQRDSLRVFLGEIGARPSDVFGSDRVMWVEGKTEESAFPLIIASHPEIELGATSVLAIRHTADFQKKDARTAVDIYKRLSEGPRLMPPTIGFILDRELLSQKEVEDLKRETKGAVAFIERRMFENYLLNAHAISSVINSIADFSPTPLDVATIERWISAQMWDKGYFKQLPPEGERSADFWLREVDAGLLLERMFEQLSEHRVRYDKPRHGLALTAWICSNNVREFDEIVVVIAKLLRSSEKGAVARTK